ncbi:unnamed protein product [Phaedon cochleariae]|uniref:TAF6 C-terminal HEAT repeat domain-containing protein n=1 Tax=Phaedon cochleariae TaxID=80249 RepID=A0A9N9S8W5_PHACE|nr:unnamed protein product [Phaedon cochleariae]
MNTENKVDDMNTHKNSSENVLNLNPPTHTVEEDGTRDSNDYNYKLKIPTEKFSPKPDIIYLKIFPDNHPLSAEEQIFFINITEGIFGYNEQIRNENLRVLAVDYNIKYLLPYLCIFIKDTVHLNISFPDLTLLIYAVRMVKSLICNQHLELIEHLHHLIPVTISCALARKICKYYHDNHWTLRDFSAFVIASICEKYNSNMNNISSRVIRIYLRPLLEYMSPLTTIYGAVKGLGCMGEEIVKTYLFPCISFISKRMFIIFERKIHGYYQEERSKQQNLEARHVRDAVVNIVAPILYKTKNVKDGGLLYSQYFGYLGKFLYMEVKNLEKIELNQQKVQAYERSAISNIPPFNNITNFNYFVPQQSVQMPSTENTLTSTDTQKQKENDTK